MNSKSTINPVSKCIQIHVEYSIQFSVNLCYVVYILKWILYIFMLSPQAHKNTHTVITTIAFYLYIVDYIHEYKNKYLIDWYYNTWYIICLCTVTVRIIVLIPTKCKIHMVRKHVTRITILHTASVVWYGVYISFLHFHLKFIVLLVIQINICSIFFFLYSFVQVLFTLIIFISFRDFYICIIYM